MLTPMVQILAFLSATFLLGLALGWLLWRFGGSSQAASETTEVQYWRQRLDQSRIERDLEKDKIAVLERERDSLKKRLVAAKS